MPKRPDAFLRRLRAKMLPDLTNPADEMRKQMRQSLTKGLEGVGQIRTRRPKVSKGGRPGAGRPRTGGD